MATQDGWESFKEKWIDNLKEQGRKSPGTSVEQDIQVVVKKMGEEFKDRARKAGMSDGDFVKKIMLEVRATVESQIGEQVKTSRDEAVDDFAKRNEWPPGGIDHDCKGEAWATNAIEFIEHNEVELRRIAQLSHTETAEVARTRFCEGGMLAERASIRANLLDRWSKQNWLIKDAVESLWKGERDEDELCMSSDRASRLVVRTILAVTESMDKMLEDPDKLSELKTKFPSNYPHHIYCFEPSTGTAFRPGDICEVKWLTRDGQQCTHVEMKLYKGIPDDGEEFGKLQFVRIVAGRTKNTGNFKWKIPMDTEEIQYAKITISHYQKGDFFEDQSHQFKILKDAPSSNSTQARPTGAKARKKKSSGEEEEVLRRMMEKMGKKSGGGTGQKLVKRASQQFEKQAQVSSKDEQEASADIRRRNRHQKDSSLFEAKLYKGISCAAFKKQTFFPKLIISYCSDLKRKGDGLGKDIMWAAANHLKDRGITSFNGYMTEGGEDWKEAWYGKLSEAKVVLVMVSEMYWQSKNCIDEIVTACRDKDSRYIIPVFLTLSPDSMMKRGFLGPADDQIQRGNFIKTRIAGNAIPSIDQGSFAQTDALFQKNLELLASKAEELCDETHVIAVKTANQANTGQGNLSNH